MSNTARHFFLSWPRSVLSTPSHMISVGSILTFSLHLRLSFPSGMFPSDFPTTTLCAPSSTHSYYMPCPSHSCWLDHPVNIVWGAKIMNLLTVQLPPLHCYFVLLRPKYLPRHAVRTLSAHHFPHFERPSCTPIWIKRQNYSSVCLNHHIREANGNTKDALVANSSNTTV